MKYELWRHEAKDVVEDAFFAVDENYQQHPELDDQNFCLVWCVEAETYDEAMQKYHEHMDWEPYKPMPE